MTAKTVLLSVDPRMYILDQAVYFPHGKNLYRIPATAFGGFPLDNNQAPNAGDDSYAVAEAGVPKQVFLGLKACLLTTRTETATRSIWSAIPSQPMALSQWRQTEPLPIRPRLDLPGLIALPIPQLMAIRQIALALRSPLVMRQPRKNVRCDLLLCVKDGSGKTPRAIVLMLRGSSFIPSKRIRRYIQYRGDDELIEASDHRGIARKWQCPDTTRNELSGVLFSKFLHINRLNG